MGVVDEVGWLVEVVVGIVGNYVVFVWIDFVGVVCYLV